MKYKYSKKVFPANLLIPIEIAKLDSNIMYKCYGMIDTGSDISAIPLKIRKKLRLKAAEFIPIKGVLDDDPQYRRLYSVKMQLGLKQSYDIKVIDRNANYAIIGRDVLNDLILHADGPAEEFELRE